MPWTCHLSCQLIHLTCWVVIRVKYVMCVCACVCKEPFLHFSHVNINFQNYYSSNHNVSYCEDQTWDAEVTVQSFYPHEPFFCVWLNIRCDSTDKGSIISSTHHHKRAVVYNAGPHHQQISLKVLITAGPLTSYCHNWLISWQGISWWTWGVERKREYSPFRSK